MIANSFAVFLEDQSFVQYVNGLSVPVFVAFSLLKYRLDNISFFFFCLFFFLSDSSSLFFHQVNLVYATSIFYLAACIHLLILVIPKLNLMHIDKSIKAYLLLMFFISILFLSLIYSAIEQVFVNGVEAMLFVAKYFALTILGLASFGMYLLTQNKKSIYFLTAVICFEFSVICNNLNIYFISEWRFSLLDRLLHIIGLYFIFKFIIEEKEIKSFKKSHADNTTMINNVLA